MGRRGHGGSKTGGDNRRPEYENEKDIFFMATSAMPTRDDFAKLLNETLGGENEGFEGRVVILVLASFLPTKPAHHAVTYAFTALAIYLWTLFLAESVHFWLRPTATALLPADAA